MALRNKNSKTENLLTMIREGKPMTLSQQLALTARLSFPAVVAQISSIAMQYIDVSMVGSLGAAPAASIGLVSTTTWLFWGVCASFATGFSVQVAHLIGAGDFKGARAVLRQSFIAVLAFSVLLALAICEGASCYFMVFAAFLPLLQVEFLTGGMLRCSGNMRVPSLLNVLMCLLDVAFNFLLIFPSHHLSVGGIELTIPGAGLGVVGAALGTGLAEAVVAAIMTWYLCTRSEQLAINRERGSFRLTGGVLKKALRISCPMGLEHLVLCGAQIMTTVIVAPLGIAAIAANSFAITAESLCYMPGYGIADAATTLVGQSIGAARYKLTRSFARITVFSGMAVMGLMGIVMYIGAPMIIGFMTPDAEILSLGVMALRIEAFAEPMFAAAIVAYGVFVGAGDTLVPCVMNLASIWAVRLTLAATLAPKLGLKGVWVAMCVELCFRGAIFLLRMYKGRWIKPAAVKP